MARHLIDECRRIGVECIVAPYEADAQLYYLEKTGIIHGIISEDSDLLAFGCKNLITKMDKFGGCYTIDRDDFTAIRGSGFSLSGWTDTEFRYMCILSGCDYLPNIPRLGLLGAYKLVKRHKTPERIIQSVRFDATKTVPVDYLDGFRRANLTFLHQWVFCPKAEKMVMVTEPDAVVDKQYLDGCGRELDAETARGIACGDLDPVTKKPFVLESIVESAIRSAWMKPKMRVLETSQSFTSISNFFKPRVEPPTTPLQEKSVNIIAGNLVRSEPQIKLKPSTPATNKRLFSQFEVKTDEPAKRPRIFPENVLEDFNVTGERSSFFSRVSRQSFSPVPRIADMPGPRTKARPTTKRTEQQETPCSSGSSSSSSSSSQKISSFPTPESFNANEPIVSQTEDEAISKVALGLKSKYGFTSGPPAPASKISRILTERRDKTKGRLPGTRRLFSAPEPTSSRIPHTEPLGDSSGESQGDSWPDFVGVRRSSASREVAQNGFGKFAFQRK
jgi:exonuclease-1